MTVDDCFSLARYHPSLVVTRTNRRHPAGKFLLMLIFFFFSEEVIECSLHPIVYELEMIIKSPAEKRNF